MLIKLIVIDSILQDTSVKSRIVQSLKHISTIVLDDNENIFINEVLEVLIGVETFTNTSSFDTQSLQFFTMNDIFRGGDTQFTYRFNE